MDKISIIIIHEIYGITECLLELKTLLEENNCIVEIPSLTDGKVYEYNDSANAYRNFVDNIGFKKGKAIIDKTIQELHRDNNKIILIGFSIGATIAWTFAEDKRIDKIIAVYGSRIRDFKHINPAIPTKLIFTKEESLNISDLINDLKTKPNTSIELLDTEHGFYNKNDSKSKEFKNTLDLFILKELSK